MSNLEFRTSQNLMMVKLDMLVRLAKVISKLYFIHLVEVDHFWIFTS